MGPAQSIYVAFEIALALLAHQGPDADLHDDFSDRQKCLLACEKRAGTNRNEK